MLCLDRCLHILPMRTTPQITRVDSTWGNCQRLSSIWCFYISWPCRNHNLTTLIMINEVFCLSHQPEHSGKCNFPFIKKKKGWVHFVAQLRSEVETLEDQTAEETTLLSLPLLLWVFIRHCLKCSHSSKWETCATVLGFNSNWISFISNSKITFYYCMCKYSTVFKCAILILTVLVKNNVLELYFEMKGCLAKLIVKLQCRTLTLGTNIIEMWHNGSLTAKLKWIFMLCTKSLI